ncbi:MAG: alpha/beta fold hydrolase [Acidobacteriota bacterium]
MGGEVRSFLYGITFAVSAFMVLALVMTIVWFLLKRRYRLSTPADERHRARTRDGWDLALYRYRPSRMVPEREPVILCHGMLTNRFNVDLNEQTSLARYLRDEGFDTWVMELRGHGGSRRAAGEDGRGFDWDLDDYILRDVPAAIQTVRGTTGSRQVHWFGHSMGGMLLYAACTLPAIRDCIRSAVLSDAPATFGPLHRPVRLGRFYGKLFPAVPPAAVLVFLGPLAWLAPAILRRRYGLDNREQVMSVLANALIDWGSSRVLLQLCEMLESGRFLSVDGTIDYERGAGLVDFPLLVLSSARTAMSEEAVRAGLERSRATHKRHVRFGRADGYSRDYTHANLLVADTSRDEIFPEVTAWFRSHSSA